MRFRSRRSSGIQNRSPLAAELQQLEPRTLPTGIVTAAVSGQNVTIRGDRLDNSILIEIRADGVFLTGAPGETATTDTTLSFDGKSVATDTAIQLSKTPSLKNLNIQMGDGNDNVLIQVGEKLLDPIPDPVPDPLAVTITGRIRINLGNGNDLAALAVAHATLSITGNLEGDLGNGNDCFVTASEEEPTADDNGFPTSFPIHVGGQAIVAGRLGDDFIALTSMEVQRAVTIIGDDGADSITLGASAVHGNVSIDGNKGDDDVLLGLITIAGTTTIRTDAGADKVIFGGVEARKNVAVYLGGGDDQLAVGGLTVTGQTARVTFDGGFGTDALSSVEVITDPPTKLKSIENPTAAIDIEVIIADFGTRIEDCIAGLPPSAPT